MHGNLFQIMKELFPSLIEILRLYEQRLEGMKLPREIKSVRFVAKPSKKFAKNQADSVQKEKNKRIKCYFWGRSGRLKRNCYEFKNEGSEKEKEESRKPEQAFMTVAGKSPAYLLIDSGASRHASSKLIWFTSCKMFDAPQPLCLGDGRCMYAKGIGDIQVERLIKGKWNTDPMSNVWYVPESGQNLFSTGAAHDKGLIEFADNKQREF
ncbi:hypothetical protein AVEN_228176-1 [Araneus ventricosus]|uniref:Retrovirus-related Pol polyprotein from transposon TNT 1-94-like beta-barrel domain-containing protein n=1 Tax=Araneus ventricosus TaxID=182803 RepID=A0A4Y2CV29_ARAVE|nr:hypothetical protein AVEN_228176-1 [Araneus ventricosus]